MKDVYKRQVLWIFVRNGNYEFRVERNSVYGRFFVSTLHILYCRLSAIFKNILEKERGHGDDAKRAGDADRNDSIIVCDRSIGGKLCKPDIFKENVKNILNRYYKIWYRRNGMI